MRTGNIFEKIKAQCAPGAFDLRTAEGRADWDEALRECILALAGDDKPLKGHASELVKYWRRDVFAAINRELFDASEHEIFAMDDTPEQLDG